MAEIDTPNIISSDCSFSKETLVEQLIEDNLHEENKDEAPENLNKDTALAKIHEGTLNQLTKGFLSLYVDDLKSMSLSFQELQKNQVAVIETLQQANFRFLDALKVYHLDDILFRVKLYTSKLQQIKRDMSVIHERSLKLKKRALKLQQQKQKEALHKEQLREEEIERDRLLAPKVITKS